MIELKLKGNLIFDQPAENLLAKGQIEVKTDMAEYFETRQEWNTGIINAASEIKVALYHIMANALPELAQCSGETPEVVARIMCSTIGCDIREFREYVDPEMKA